MHKKKTSAGKKVAAVFCVLLCVVGAVSILSAGALLGLSGKLPDILGIGGTTSDTPAPTEPLSVVGTQAQGMSQQPTVLLPRENAGSAYLSRILFIGDSRINGMKSQLPQGNAIAYDGMNHLSAQTLRFINMGTGRLLSIPEAIGVRKPEIVLVAFGINGVAFMGEENFMKEYATLLDMIHRASPSSIIIIQSILPVSSAREREDPRMANTKIDHYNDRLAGLAAEKGAYFLNAAEAFKDSSGALAARYDRGDGLHFSSAAGDAFIEYVNTHPVI